MSESTKEDKDTVKTISDFKRNTFSHVRSSEKSTFSTTLLRVGSLICYPEKI